MQADLALSKHGDSVEHVARAGDLYRQSIALARQAGTLAFEIPATLGLARLELQSKKSREALATLRSTLVRAPYDDDLPLMLEVKSLIEGIESHP